MKGDIMETAAPDSALAFSAEELAAVRQPKNGKAMAEAAS